MDKPDNKVNWERANWTVALLSVICLCIFTYIFTQWQQNGSFLPVWGDSSQIGDEQTNGLITPYMIRKQKRPLNI